MRNTFGTVFTLTSFGESHGAAVGGVVYALVLLVLGISPSLVDAVFLRAVPGAVLDCVALFIVAAVLSRTSANSGGLGGGAHGRGGYTLRRGL